MIIIKKGDTRHAVEATLKIDGSPIDLTNCNVYFYMSNGINGLAQVSDALNGVAVYPLEADAVANTGMIKAEFKVVYPDGREVRFPNSGAIKIYIENNLEG